MSTSPISSKFRQAAYVAGSFVLAGAMLAALLGIDMQAATARTEPDSSDVNRTLKGNRLPLVSDPGFFAPQSRTHQPKLPEGCVSNFNAAPHVFWVEVPGRCVSAIPGPSSRVG